MLLLDETAYGKKGKCSAGVARQWNGRLGKVDNCQVGVFAALCRGTVAALVQSRLYLPDEWVKDGQRCKKAGIPAEHCELRSKSTLALELVARTRRLGLRYAWVGADAGYGKEPRFLRSLADAGERFMVDVHRTQRGFLQDPKPSLPTAELPKQRGRQPSRLVTHQPVLTVEGWARSQPASAWQDITVRHTTLGLLRVQALRTVFWLWDHEELQARRWTLLVVRELENPSEISFTLTNADESLATQLLVQVQRQRFWIENAFGDAKSEIGLADYEVRTWTGWHRHMTLCMLAQLFTIEQRFEESESIPMLSTRDVRTLLSCLLSGRRHLLERFCQTVADRQNQRWKSIVSRYLKQGEAPVFLTVKDSTM
jgi:SRSO17 transposase